MRNEEMERVKWRNGAEAAMDHGLKKGCLLEWERGVHACWCNREEENNETRKEREDLKATQESYRASMEEASVLYYKEKQKI